MRHVYLAYAPDDADFAALLTENLLRSEFHTWSSQASQTGGEPREAVDIAIREALAVVVILSRSSVQSAPVNYDWAYALGSGVPVLPVLLKIAESDLHPRLKTLHYLDFTKLSDGPWHLLIRSLEKVESAQRPATVQVPRNAPPVVQQAARALDVTNAEERAAALASLGQMDHPTAIEVLAEAVRHPVQQVRFGAAILLAAHRDARAVPALLDGVRAGSRDVEPWMLGNIGASAVPALLRALEDGNEDVQDTAASQLARIGGPEAIMALTDTLRDSDANKRRYAASALSYAVDPAAIQALIQATRDTEKAVRRSAAYALVKCAAAAPNYDELLPVWIEALEDEDDQVAIQGAEGLAITRDPRAIPPLVRAALTNPQDQVRAFSRSALKAFGAAGAPELRLAATSPDRRTRYRAINLLRELHDESDAALYIQSTYDEDPDVRNTAVCALGDSGLREGIPALIERLNDTDDSVREMAARALAAVPDPRAIPALVQCLDDEDEEFAGKAAHALSEIGTREARLALRAWKRLTNK